MAVNSRKKQKKAVLLGLPPKLRIYTDMPGKDERLDLMLDAVCGELAACEGDGSGGRLRVRARERARRARGVRRAPRVNR